jgi:hypothetical protein
MAGRTLMDASGWGMLYNFLVISFALLEKFVWMSFFSTFYVFPSISTSHTKAPSTPIADFGH